jgi:hypothetical protein
MTLYSTGYAKRVDLGFGGFAWVSHDWTDVSPDETYSGDAYERAVNFFRDPYPANHALASIPHEWLISGEVDVNEYVEQIKTNMHERVTHEKDLREIYLNLIPSELHLGCEFEWRFNLQIQNPSEVLDALLSNNLFASSHFGSVAFPISGSRAPNAERAAQHMVNLFTDHRYSPSMAERSAQIVARVAKPVKS